MQDSATEQREMNHGKQHEGSAETCLFMLQRF